MVLLGQKSTERHGVHHPILVVAQKDGRGAFGGQGLEALGEGAAPAPQRAPLPYYAVDVVSEQLIQAERVLNRSAVAPPGTACSYLELL